MSSRPHAGGMREEPPESPALESTIRLVENLIEMESTREAYWLRYPGPRL